MISEPGVDRRPNPGGASLPAALELDMPDPSVRFEDEVVAPRIDIRPDHLDTVMPDEPAVLEDIR